jgi:peptidyl-prolyl cis-trans isomerase D
MLHLMRKHAGSWMIKIVLFAIVVVFVFWGVGSMRSRKATRVADINGEIITQETYRQAYYRLVDNYRRIYGEQYNDALLKMLRPNETALDQLINNALMTQEADRLGIEASEEAVADAIRSVPAFQSNGSFDYQRYNLLLAQNNLTPEQFESARRDEIILDKLRAVVLSGVTVTEDEVREWYDWSNAQINLTYALFSATRYKDIQPSEDEIQSYFKEHGDVYRTEPRIRVRYLYFNPDDYKAEIKISDEQIAEYYDSHLTEFKTEKRVKARHILIKVDEGADEKIVEAKKAETRKIYEMASAGQEFAALAQKYSEGPSKDQGGDLGWFTRDKMVASFAEKAFAMKVGEISEPVRTRFGWHVIKVEQVEEASTKALEGAADGIRRKLVAEEAKAEALTKAEAVYDSVFDGDDLSAAGEAHQVPVAITDFFTAQSGPKEKGIGQPQKFSQVSFGLEKMAISQIQDLENGYYILQMTERAEAVVPPFDQVADQVKADLIKVRQDQKAKADAEAFLGKVRSGQSFADVSAGFKVDPLETGFFTRNGAIPQIGYEPQMQQDAFQLTMEKPLLEKTIQGRQGWYVLQLKNRQAPDETGFVKEKASIMKRLTEQKKQATFESWLQDLKSKSKIEINEELTRL